MLLNDIVSPANRVVIGLLRSRAHVIASKGLMVLSWEGRRSGNHYTIPVGYQRDGDAIVVLLSKPHDKTWWKNFREPWPAELLVRNTVMPVEGALVAPGTDQFFEDIERTLRRLPWMGSQFGGIKYDKETGLTDEQRTVLCDHVADVRFTASD
jgi:hypothetical protein